MLFRSPVFFSPPDAAQMGTALGRLRRSSIEGRSGGVGHIGTKSEGEAAQNWAGDRSMELGVGGWMEISATSAMRRGGSEWKGLELAERGRDRLGTVAGSTDVRSKLSKADSGQLWPIQRGPNPPLSGCSGQMCFSFLLPHPDGSTSAVDARAERGVRRPPLSRSHRDRSCAAKCSQESVCATH